MQIQLTDPFVARDLSQAAGESDLHRFTDPLVADGVNRVSPVRDSPT